MKHILRFCVIAGVQALACLGSLCAAVPAEPADTVRQLGEVTVKAKRPYVEVIPAQTLSGPRLEGLNSQSVADAMRYFSGVQIKDYGGVGGIKTIDVRSMGSQQVGVFYDGIQLGNAQNGQIDLGRYSLDNVEAIRIYNGQRSEIFQPARDFGASSAVYITTKRPQFDDDKNFNLIGTFRTGSFGLANPSVRFDYKLSNRVSATAAAEYTYASGRYRFRYRKVLPDGSTAWDTTAVRQNGEIHALRLEGALHGTTPRGYWNAKLYFYDSDRGIPGAIVNNVWKNSQKQWDRNFHAQSRFVNRFNALYTLMVNGKYARDYMRYLNPDTTLLYVDNRFWQDELYLSAANRFSVTGNLNVNVSVDWQWNKLDATLVNFALPVRNALQGAVAAAWFQGPVKCQGSLLGTFVNDRYTVSNTVSYSRRETRTVERLTPALFFSVAPLRHEQLNLRAFFKQTFRMPTFNDLYYTDMGNARLLPERATQWNVGATWHRDFSRLPGSSLDISVDAYHNIVSDKIIAVPKGNGQYRWMMMNIGRVKINGLDLSAGYLANPVDRLMLNLHLNYTFQLARDYSDASDNLDAAGTWGGQIAYIPKHSGSATVNASWHPVELNYSFIYVGERWENSSNIPVNYVQPWYTHDISASVRFKVARTQLKLTAEINNLLNQQYEVIKNYPMPGRNFRAIIQLNL